VTRIDRVAARVLVLDQAGALLLFHGMDPADPGRGSWWFTPGGGLEIDETPDEGARRELFEETGLVAGDLGPVLFERLIDFDFDGVSYRQRESFYCVRTERFEPVDTAWSELEQRATLGHRWWTLAEIIATDDQLYPERLAERLAVLLGVDLDDEGSRPPVG
jgi:8-oxo-dGTP pyrophosphatase MutT (NUDIX family)